MSRRSRIPDTDALLRSQRRDVPNARMWSEAPLPPQVGWDGVETEPDFVEPVVLPTATQVFNIAANTPGYDLAQKAASVAGGTMATVVLTSGAAAGNIQGSIADPPAGWSTLGRGAVGAGFVVWAAFATSDLPSAGTAWIGQPGGTLTVYVGGGGGTWSLSLGAARYNRRSCGYAAPPAGAHMWQQFGIYTPARGTETIPADMTNTTFGGVFVRPLFGSYSGSAFDATFVNNTPYVEGVTPDIVWGHLGMDGIAGSIPLCIGWNP